MKKFSNIQGDLFGNPINDHQDNTKSKDSAANKAPSTNTISNSNDIDHSNSLGNIRRYANDNPKGHSNDNPNGNSFDNPNGNSFDNPNTNSNGNPNGNSNDNSKKDSNTIKKNKISFGFLLHTNPFGLDLIKVFYDKSGKRMKRTKLKSNTDLAELKHLPKPFLDVLQKLTSSQLNLLSEQKIDPVSFWYQQFQYIKPFQNLCDWYYAAKNTDLPQAIEIKKAHFSNITPNLNFKIIRNPAGYLRIAPVVVLNQSISPLEDFKQFDFLLQLKSEWFLLKEADFLMLKAFNAPFKECPSKKEADELQWLSNLHSNIPQNFPILKSDILEKKLLSVEPDIEINLAELNSNFLMITPNFRYDQFSIYANTAVLPKNTHPFDGENCYVVETINEKWLIEKKNESEASLLNELRNSHPKFKNQSGDYFYLSFSEAEKNQWFLKFFRTMVAKGHTFNGMDKLSHFKYNPFVPKLTITPSVFPDFIFLSIHIHFGQELVPLKTIWRAFQSQQPHFLLSDSSIGMLPHEWMEAFHSLSKLVQPNSIHLPNQKNQEGIQLKLYHQHLVNFLLSAVAPDLVESFQEQLNKYLNQSDAPASKNEPKGDATTTSYPSVHTRWRMHQTNPGSLYPVPPQIRANLRTYQHAGFEWACLLQEMSAGGCLADDMGLGKTLQTISFIQHQWNQYPHQFFLVICPTSLIFNWEAEWNKFCPDTPIQLYHGPDRHKTNLPFLSNHPDFNPISSEKNTSINHDDLPRIIITSYGSVRSDIDLLKNFHFKCIVLDESHTIKNPDSQTAKAILQLQSDHRFILSGTPIQNNTMDLYAQMEFINPGIFGNRNAFRETFANPIDKFKHPYKTKELQQMINPFILRRTKKQVAPDLPEKTEMILWCEMNDTQRNVYNSIRELYKSKLKHSPDKNATKKQKENSQIENDNIQFERENFQNEKENFLNKNEKINEGLDANNKTLMVLEGLTRLRQACNAPQLIPGWENTTETPVKIEQLLESIQEIQEHHKTLVFSQFTGMLKEIEKALNEANIPYLYLDGKTPAEERQKLVKKFQDNPEERVFLISLKAGGVGLTLTSADYVYLVDPWWNPAAEQQAIDRTHRIGQTQKVFAYKMICKNSVEEKILKLQEKKKKLSEEIISEETGFLKSLTDEELDWLFS